MHPANVQKHRPHPDQEARMTSANVCQKACEKYRKKFEKIEFLRENYIWILIACASIKKYLIFKLAHIK